jgi:hypothetical protein
MRPRPNSSTFLRTEQRFANPQGSKTFLMPGSLKVRLGSRALVCIRACGTRSEVRQHQKNLSEPVLHEWPGPWNPKTRNLDQPRDCIRSGCGAGSQGQSIVTLTMSLLTISKVRRKPHRFGSRKEQCWLLLEDYESCRSVADENQCDTRPRACTDAPGLAGAYHSFGANWELVYGSVQSAACSHSDFDHALSIFSISSELWPFAAKLHDTGIA